MKKSFPFVAINLKLYEKMNFDMQFPRNGCFSHVV